MNQTKMFKNDCSQNVFRLLIRGGFLAKDLIGFKLNRSTVVSAFRKTARQNWAQVMFVNCANNQEWTYKEVNTVKSCFFSDEVTQCRMTILIAGWRLQQPSSQLFLGLGVPQRWRGWISHGEQTRVFCNLAGACQDRSHTCSHQHQLEEPVPFKLFENSKVHWDHLWTGVGGG